jgi:hypothetical protein
MKHNKKFEELGLMDFYGELTAPEKALFELHLKKCPVCQAQRQQLEAMRQKIAQAPELKPTPVLLNRLNDAILDRIDRLDTVKERVPFKERLSQLAALLFGALARPRYQLVALMATFLVGVVVGKLWLSSGLRQHPDMLANIINYNYQLTSDERENLQKVMAGYLLRSNGIEINDLLQAGTEGESDGIIAVNLKLSKDMALTGGLDDPTIQSLLMYAARQDADSVRRQRAVRLLTQAEPNPGIIQTLTAVMLHESWAETRLLAAKALQSQPTESEILEAFKVVALRDSSTPMRELALRRLIEHGSADVLPILALVTSREPDKEIRQIAQEALDQLYQKYSNQSVRIDQ